MSSADQQHFSLVYGVNRRALLNTLTYFSVASGALIPDIMHDVLEGVLPLEVKLMLKVDYIHMYVRVLQKNFLFIQVYVVDKKLFTLNFIDDGFKKLNLRSFDGDKPSALSSVSLTCRDSNLHQHGAMFVHMDFVSIYHIDVSYSPCSHANVDFGSISSPCHWTPDP